MGWLSSGLSVGEVAGLIGGATSFVTATLPLFFGFILIWAISGRRLNAVTWSVTARTLQETSWPTILCTDSVQTKHVSWRVTVASWAMTIAAGLVLVAQSLTPLPLVSDVEPQSRSSMVGFQYAPDLTFFGRGTSPRPNMPLSRMCGYPRRVSCPDARAASGSAIDTAVSEDLLELFSSGTTETTVAGPQHIQFRNFMYQNSSIVDGRAWRAAGYFRPMESLLLGHTYRVIEGLIVDAVSGGVGFRNHTVPSNVELGSTWTEDLLWVQPVTVCSPTNFSLHFTLKNRTTGFLQDDGAFAKHQWKKPQPRWDIWNGSAARWNASGPIPDLKQRAYLASWWNNHITATALNLSADSHLSVGDKYTDNFTIFTSFITGDSISISNMDGSYLDSIWPYNLNKFISNFMDRFMKQDLSKFIPGVSESTDFARQFLKYGRRCSGYDDGDLSDPIKPYIRCGNLYGVPAPVDNTGASEIKVDSEWRQLVYTCASSVKASIKTVELRLNGSAPVLSNLTVNKVVDKEYPDKAREPLWAVEKIDATKNLTNLDIDLLWGIIADRYANSPRIVTRRARELWLPAANQVRTLAHFTDTLAAVSAFTTAWNSVYTLAGWVAGASIDRTPSYSGESQYALFLKWRDLSGSPDGASQILNLIWTDLVASTVVGTKTGFKDMSATQNGSNKVLGMRPVRTHKLVIMYTNIWFAVPAFVIGAFWAVGLVWALFLFASRAVTLGMVRHYMNHTSLGRAVHDAAYPDYRAAMAETRVWRDEIGVRVLDVRQYLKSAFAKGKGAGRTIGGVGEAVDLESRASGALSDNDNGGITQGKPSTWPQYGI